MFVGVVRPTQGGVEEDAAEEGAEEAVYDGLRKALRLCEGVFTSGVRPGAVVSLETSTGS